MTRKPSSGLKFRSVSHLKKSLTHQFPETKRYIVEYATNAADAGALEFLVELEQVENKRVRVTMKDDGTGINCPEEYSSLFLSVKDNPEAAIGINGAGRLSAAAVPGHGGFQIKSTTTTQTWTATFGQIDTDDDVEVAFFPNPGDVPTGTEISFEYDFSGDLAKEQDELVELLTKYLQFLPLSMSVTTLRQGKIDEAIPVPFRTWPSSSGSYSCAFSTKLEGRTYHVVFEFGAGGNDQLYQKLVWLTDKAVLSEGDEHCTPPDVRIRIDCMNDALPMGRHDIQDAETVVPKLGVLARSRLPQFALDVARFCLHDPVAKSPIPFLLWCLLYNAPEFEELANLSLFLDHKGGFFSLNALRDCPIIFVTNDVQSAITNPPPIDAPVLVGNATPYTAQVLDQEIQADIVDLDTESLVVVEPDGNTPIPEQAVQLQRLLRLNPGSHIELDDVIEVGGTPRRDAARESAAGVELSDLARQCSLRFGYLVDRNGNSSHKEFLACTDTEVVLNLHAARIQKLVEFSVVEANLAAHFIFSLLLTDTSAGRPLSHIPVSVRDALLSADAKFRALGSTAEPEVRNANRRRFVDYITLSNHLPNL